MTKRAAALFTFTFPLAVALAACGAKQEGANGPNRGIEPKDVQIFHGSPPMQTDNVGPVSAVCSDNVSDDDCLLQLREETVKLGGDVVWGVAEKPTVDPAGKKHWSGRAAHTKSTPAPPSTPSTPPG
jgi:hypothetical protein